MYGEKGKFVTKNKKSDNGCYSKNFIMVFEI